MTAVYINATVVDGSNTKHWPSPAYPFYPPVIIDGKTSVEISGPFDVDASINQSISTPINLNSISFLSLSAPNSLTKQSVIDVIAPVTLSFSASQNIALPIEITGLSVLGLTVPASITGESVVDIAIPNTLTIVSVGTLAIPISLNSVSVVDLAIPVNVPASAVIDVDIPGTLSVVSIIDVAIPISITAASLISISLPVSVPASAAVDIAIPVDITESAAIDLAVPVAISANALDPELPPFALNHARILYDNLLLISSVITSSGLNGGFTLIPNTAQRWTFTATASQSIKFTLPDNLDIDTVCIGAHNLGDLGATVTAFYDTDLTDPFTQLAPLKVVTNNNSIMFHIDTAVSARRIQINITDASGPAYIGSIYAGIALQMQRPFYSGHSPITLSASTTYFSSRSESGAFIGREIRKREYQTSAAWKNITDTWYRAYFQPFVLSAKTLPFYFAWNLLEHSSDVAYCITNADISPSYQGNRDLMQVGFDMIGVG